MPDNSHPSIRSGAHANLPRGQVLPRFPTASLYPPERLPQNAEFNPDWSDWKFEYRRNMQEVLPGVFLGPLQVARNIATLRANKITYVIPVRTPNTERFLPVPIDETGHTWVNFPVDIKYDQIMNHFYRIYEIVTKEVSEGGKVLIYCENGNGLSAAVCVALVMDMRLWDYRTAREFVQRKRYSIDIPDWARFALEQYQPVVEARAQTEGIADFPRSTRRRVLDEVYEEEIAAGAYALGLPYWEEPRPAVAPFSSDYNGMIDDDASVEVTYPPEKVEEEDEVMMDFVAGR